MLKQFPLTELVKAVQANIQKNTDMKCYDVVPKDAVSPFTYIQVVNAENVDNKTMFMKNHEVWIHVIADSTQSSVPIYKLVQAVEEAMTEDITIPDPFNLIMQTDEGMQTIQDEETGEKHAIVVFKFLIAYGFKTKI
jgi:hypothetical protein